MIARSVLSAAVQSDPTSIDPQRRRLLQAAGAAACLGLLSACTTAPRRTVPVTLELEYRLANDVNPDPNGRPSPVLLRVYKLRKLEQFRVMDYFALSAQPNHSEFSLEEEFSLQPGAQGQRSYTLEPDQIGFGVVAAYRDIAISRWRASEELPPLKVSRIKLPEVLTRADPVMSYRLEVARNQLTLARLERR
jgi:type VI secretion system protein VasD